MGKEAVRRSNYFALLIGIIGLSMAAFLLPSLGGENLFLTISLCLLAVAIEALPILIGEVFSSLTIALAMGALILYGAHEAVWLMIIAAFVGPHIPKRTTGWLMIFFNTGQYALAMLAMAGVYQAIYPPEQVAHVSWQMFFALLVGALSYLAVNHLLFTLLKWFRSPPEWRFIPRLYMLDSIHLIISFPFTFLMIALGPIQFELAPLAILPILILAFSIRLMQKSRDMETAHREVMQLASEFNIHELCYSALKIVTKFAPIDAAAIYRVVEEDCERILIPYAVYPEVAQSYFLHDKWKENDQSFIWDVLKRREFLYLPDLHKEKQRIWNKQHKKYVSVAIVPMYAHEHLAGVMLCCAERSHAFRERIELISTIGSQVSVLVENARLYQELRERSMRDEATGLYNYRYFYEQLAQQFEQASKLAEPLSVVIVDIDFFKKFNDTYGHLAGDKVLQSTGHLLQEMTGSNAIVARYGGEEFAILLHMDAQAAFTLMEKIRVAVSQLVVEYREYPLQGITVSCGLANYPEHGLHSRDVLLKADSAMYWGAKQRGRNLCAVYQPEYDAQLFVDELTGLYTYHFAKIRVHHEMMSGQKKWGIVCLEIKQFHLLNDKYGFSVGNNLLREMSVRVRASLPHDALVCRHSVDEILILLPNASEEETCVVGEKLVKVITEPYLHVLADIPLQIEVMYAIKCLAEMNQQADLFTWVSALFSQMHQSVEESSISI